ncbi:unnamed protein product [Oppiella nova]|uniref:Nuclear receptor domain-containing protein n=1 Tax=Oppiella nova TaxID=334625 RepID=A0A7R9LWC1_9ACAR|nr:unnamed protein product [Oppiella nova]CAG2167605.1 unnamed protein product [Oppiella nova]
MNEEIKKCVICGDKASGNNFNVMTCESCKAFFRRNALKSMEFQCSLRGNCQINLISRKYCRSCRLKKCLSMGMKKEYILSDELKQLRRIIRSNKIVAENTIDFTTEMNSISDVVYRKVVEFDFAVIPIPRPITDTKTFGELEGYRLSELLNATNILINPLTDNKITYEVKDMVEAQREWCRNFEKEIPKYVKSAKVLAIILFNDERPNLLDKELVKLQQHVYMYLLQRYLLMRYESENEAKLKLLRFMNGLHDIT